MIFKNRDFYESITAEIEGSIRAYLDSNGKQRGSVKWEKERRQSGELKKAWEAAGWRERYAMRYGKTRYFTDGFLGHRMVKFILSARCKHQNANGATWDRIDGIWIH